MAEKIVIRITTSLFKFLLTYLSSSTYAVVKINNRTVYKIGIKQYVCAFTHIIFCVIIIFHSFINYKAYFSELKFVIASFYYHNTKFY